MSLWSGLLYRKELRNMFRRSLLSLERCWGCRRMFARSLHHTSPWPSNAPSQLDVPLHDSHALRMNGTKVPWANRQDPNLPFERRMPLTRPQTGGQGMPLLLLVVPE